MALISVVCPFYNEAAGVVPFFASLVPVLERLGDDFEIVCVNDGSTDGTLAQLQACQARDGRIRVIDLSRNFGKEAALTAAIDHAAGDAIIPIDADLQDPPELIPRLVAKWREGFEVVLARRVDRRCDTALKRITANGFYRLHNRIADVAIPEDVGDFRLMDRIVVEALRALPERRRFMKGLLSWVGFRTTSIDYRRAPRTTGATKFNGWQLWNLALEGITAFSSVPLRMWTYIGLTISLSAFAYASFIVLRTLVHGVDVPGYASLLTVTLMLGGVQLIGLGVVGEYIARIYTECKQRPVYVVRPMRDTPGEGLPRP